MREAALDAAAALGVVAALGLVLGSEAQADCSAESELQGFTTINILKKHKFNNMTYHFCTGENLA